MRDVALLTDFYHDHFGLPIVERDGDDWTVFQAGSCQLALHLAGEPYPNVARAPGTSGANSNAKIVFTVPGDLHALRKTLIARGVPVREIVSFPGTGPLCDGTDPEGNVFQLAQG